MRQRCADAIADSLHSLRAKYQVSACLIFKDCGRYLAEWIEFHHMAGIEHFYLYNNNSKRTIERESQKRKRRRIKEIHMAMVMKAVWQSEQRVGEYEKYKTALL